MSKSCEKGEKKLLKSFSGKYSLQQLHPCTLRVTTTHEETSVTLFYTWNTESLSQVKWLVQDGTAPEPRLDSTSKSLGQFSQYFGAQHRTGPSHAPLGSWCGVGGWRVKSDPGL